MELGRREVPPIDKGRLTRPSLYRSRAGPGEPALIFSAVNFLKTQT